MLSSLEISNVMLIKEASFDFSKGLNIISGETGAGKSMLLKSINFALGEKVGIDFIRNGEESAYVTLTLGDFSDEVIEKIAEINLYVDDDDKLVITRTIDINNKKTLKINGKTVSVAILKELKSLVIDFHSQHQTHLLLNETKHIALLDTFCKDEITEPKNNLKVLLDEYKTLNNEIKVLSGDEEQRTKKIELLQFQIEEIGNAELYEGCDEELELQKSYLQNLEKIKKASNKAYDILTNNYDGGSLIGMLSFFEDEVNSLEILDSVNDSVKEISENTITLSTTLNDLKKQLKIYIQNQKSDAKELEEITEKIKTINTLKKKYGDGIKEIFEFQENAKLEYEKIINSEEIVKELLEKRNSVFNSVTEQCEQISEIRRNASIEIREKLLTHLNELGMENCNFEAEIVKTKEISSQGFDKVTFLIATNKGDNLKSIAKVASGGEMSRVMLSLKATLSDSYLIDTFVFDEIDTGVSGRTAQKVAEKLKLLSLTHQIICITHLPQIAAMADKHIKIEKTDKNEETITTVTELDFDKSVNEIARLLGGVKITEQTQKASVEMKKLALNLKI